jgi:hypothetical protein
MMFNILNQDEWIIMTGTRVNAFGMNGIIIVITCVLLLNFCLKKCLHMNAHGHTGIIPIIFYFYLDLRAD